MKIWTLDDGIPGHWSMTAGLTRLFRATRPVEETRIRVEWRWGAARQVFQRMERAGLRVPGALFRAATRFEPMPVGAPDLIVSRGGATLLANAWLARETGARNVFVGTLRKMPERLFSAVILYQDDRLPAPYFPMPLFPNRIDQAALPAAVVAFPWSGGGRPAGEVAAMFLGGDGSGYRYAAEDWRAIARGMAELHARAGVRWCVTSSRRTPAEAEAVFREVLPEGAVAEACWWHAGDRRSCMDAFLGAAGAAFCTEDSMSMLEECVASGRPVVAVRPAVAEANGFFREFLAQRAGARRLRRAAADFAAGLPWPPRPEAGDWDPVGADAMAESAARLLATLGL